MAKQIIPWEVFIEALNLRPKARLAEWLAMWRFTDEGAFIQPAQTLPEKHSNERIGTSDVDFSGRLINRSRTLH